MNIPQTTQDRVTRLVAALKSAVRLPFVMLAVVAASLVCFLAMWFVIRVVEWLFLTLLAGSWVN